MLDFPQDPVLAQAFAKWVWDGEKWIARGDNPAQPPQVPFPITIDLGGTGAITAAAALDNLALVSGTDEGALQRNPDGSWILGPGGVGPEGPPGPAGPTGATGATGATGPAGADGATGPMGPTGATGPMGPTGATGPQGPPAAAAVTGPATSTDNALARWDGTTGTLIQDSPLATLGDDGTFTIAIAGQTAFKYDPNLNNGTVTLGAKPPHGQTISFCARSDINGSARFFGAADYTFSSGLNVLGPVTVLADPTTPLQLATKRYVDSKVFAVTIADTAPTLTNGALWFSSLDTQLYVGYNDGDSQQWVVANNVSGAGMALPNPVTVPFGGTGSTSFPVTTWAANPEWGLITRTFLIGQGTGPVVASANLNASIGIIQNAQLALWGAGAASFYSPAIISTFNRGSQTSPAGVTLGDSLGSINFQGHDGTTFYGAAAIVASVQDVWSSSLRGTHLHFWSTDAGAQNSQVTFEVGRNIVARNPITLLRGKAFELYNSAGTKTAYWDAELGAVTISPPAHARIFLSKGASGNTSAIYGQKAGVTRWSLELGGVVPESTGNLGSDFALGRFADDGSWIDNPITANRATGVVSISRQLATYNHVPASDMSLDYVYTGHVHMSDFAWNAYITSGGAWKRIGADVATIVGLTGGQMSVFSAPTGAAGSTITLSQVFAAQANGSIWQSGYYHYFAASSGAVNGSGGSFLYGDSGSIVAHLPGNGTVNWFMVQNANGGQVGGFRADGAVCSLAGRVVAYNDGNYNTLYYANGYSGSIFIPADNSGNWNIFRAPNRFSFQNTAGTEWGYISAGGVASVGSLLANVGVDGNTWIGCDGATTYFNVNGSCFIAYTRSNGDYNIYVNGSGRFLFQYGFAAYFQNNFGPCAGVGAYVNNSDARMKEDIEDLDQGLDTILKLKPVKYTRIEYPYPEGPTPEPQRAPRRRELGFLAQDLLDSLPESVAELPHGICGITSFEGSNLPPLGIQSEMILAVVVKALQELNAKVDARLH